MRPILCQKPASAVEPSWITRSNAGYNLSNSKLLDDAKDGYIDLVHELQVNMRTHTTYHRTVIRIITEAGIQNRSQVSVNYDPSYQRLLFHTISIIRNGRIINKLDLSKIKTIHQEKELERNLYNGTVESVLFLEDVRKGDIIEYAYSVQGFNPIFRDKFCDIQEMQFGAPVGQILYRVICPSSRRLAIQYAAEIGDPVIKNQGADKIYQWSRNNVPALREQDALPSWYDPYPLVQVSEFLNWTEVSQWAGSLFTYDHPLSAGLKKKIAEIKAGSKGDKEKEVLAALRFVQDEVRYMGIEMGVNSYKPNDPNKIFAQRFGDCKDKSYLLCTMLRAMDIDAAPVLINTSDKQELRNTLPSAVAFDHCTLRIILGKKTWWFDPTISFQRGGIGDISYPDYKCGLVLTDTTTDLTDIPLQAPGQVVAKEKFTLSDDHGPVKMEVTSAYTGSFADQVREEINNNSISDLQQNYLDFYDDYYKGIKVSDSLRIEEEETGGKVITHEFYTIDKLWTLKDGSYRAPFDGVLIHSLINKPKAHVRTMPIAINYPTHYTEDIQILVPEDWDLDRPSTEVRSSSFLFKQTVASSSRMVHITYEYQTLKDHVPAGEAMDFLADCDKMEYDLGYDLIQHGDRNAHSYSEPQPSQGLGMDNNLMKSLLCLFLLGGIVYLVRRR
jgi:hypothetical protein